MTSDMAGRVVFITGPARGIGAALARALAARGARLALAGLEPALLATLATELGPAHVWFECDVTDQAALDRAVAGAVETLGGIDVVVANAGIASHGTVAVTPPAALARVIDVNLTGVIRTAQSALPHLVARRGYALLISSAASLAPMPGLAAYAAAKAGVEQFANALRMEVAHKGVAVGSAHPCWIETDLVRDARADLRAFDEMVGRLPGPFSSVTPVERCAAALADGIARRKRKIFVPRSLGALAAVRSIITSRFSEWIMSRDTARLLPGLEQEMADLGRAFGEHSVETKRNEGSAR